MRFHRFFKIALVPSFIMVGHLNILLDCQAHVDERKLMYQIDGNRYSTKKNNKLRNIMNFIKSFGELGSQEILIGGGKNT